MKKSLLLFALVLSVNFTSCNKDDLEKRNEELLVQIESLKRQINDLSEDFLDLSTDNDNLSNQIEILQNKIDELEKALNNMTNDYELSEQYNNELYEDYLALVNSKNELQARLDNLISDISFSCPPIEFTDLDKNLSLAIIDLSGRKVLQKENLKAINQFDLSAFESGVYYLNVYNKESIIGRLKLIRR